MMDKPTHNEVFRTTNEAHQQVRVGVCSCGREFFSSGRHNRNMWRTHRIYEEAQALKRAELESQL